MICVAFSTASLGESNMISSKSAISTTSETGSTIWPP